MLDIDAGKGLTPAADMVPETARRRVRTASLILKMYSMAVCRVEHDVRDRRKVSVMNVDKGKILVLVDEE